VENGHGEEVGGRRGGFESLDELIWGGQLKDIGEGDRAQKLDSQAHNDGWVLGVLLEEGGETGEESRDERGDVGVCQVSVINGKI
jgi:hypothetical protein